ncbi:CBS domain-containing protein [Proteinivorax hydrogeniformans]|uniref:CBS domain-containing protein n=1 Tax=Proteinivorax hydrogeniformans TaxID=1826727 RepID=A0AAU8HRK3_9FIRM
MTIGNIMSKDFSTVIKEESISDVVEKIHRRDHSVAFVIDEDNKLCGMVTNGTIKEIIAKGVSYKRPIEDVMISKEKTDTLNIRDDILNAINIFKEKDIRFLPVLKEEEVVGVISQRKAMKFLIKKQVQDGLESRKEKKARMIVESLNEGLIVVDKDLTVMEFNPAAEKMTGLKADERIGKKSENRSKDPSIVEMVIKDGIPRFNQEVKMRDGRIFLVNYVPLKQNGDIEGVVQSFSDITAFKQLQDQVSKTKEELDKAFALTLPNSKVEYKLKATPEYIDAFDPSTNTIKITDVIKSGGYVHVVNSLKVAADFNEMGLMKLIGIEKDTLVESIIFHDLGKSQPDLNIGDIVSPNEAFELGILHAARSADMAEKYYNKAQDVVTIIRYHHHPEDKLPKDFPTHLLPLLRLFQVIDGLSAAITRRNAKVTYKVDGSKLKVVEQNEHPKYNRVLNIDLYTGRTEETPLKQGAEV